MSERQVDHPWSNFLEARARAIDWLHDEGRTDDDIAATLSMDTTQVWLIRTRDRKLDKPPRKARKARMSEQNEHAKNLLTIFQRLANSEMPDSELLQIKDAAAEIERLLAAHGGKP